MRTHRPGCVAARSIWIAGLIALISLGSLSAQPVPAAAAFDDVIFLATGTGPYHFEVLDNDLLATGILSYESPKHGTLELNGGTFTYRPSTGWFDERVVDSFTYVVTYPATLSEEQTIIAKATVILMHEDRRVFEDGAESGLPPGLSLIHI